MVDKEVLAGWRWVYFQDPDGYPLEEAVEVAFYNEQERRAGIEALFRVAIVSAACGSWTLSLLGVHDPPIPWLDP